MPYEPPPELATLSLAQIAALAAERRLPPITQWHPDSEGDSLMRIAADGRWFHDGGEITRPAMVRAFASILVRDEHGQHWLMTPTQKLSVAVDDVAFLAVDMLAQDDGIAFRLNVDDLLVAGPEHPIRVAGTADTPAIYIAVRHGTEARLNRSTYAQLIELALAGAEEHGAQEHDDGLAVSSQGMRFALLPR